MIDKIKKLFICPRLFYAGLHSVQTKMNYACAILSARLRSGNILFTIILPFFQQINNFFTDAEKISIQEVFPHHEILRYFFYVTQNSSRFTFRRFQILEENFLRWDEVPSHPHWKLEWLSNVEFHVILRGMKAASDEGWEISSLRLLPRTAKL